MPPHDERGLPTRPVAVALLAALALTAPAAGAGTVRFVDDDALPGGDGRAWKTAARSLQDLLVAVEKGEEEVTEIRVAQGEYAPDEGESVITGDRRATFHLLHGVALRGGFAGVGEADPDERDVVRFPTILTGDLDRDDGPGRVGNGENSYHVVTADDQPETTILDGFTIRGGNADGSVPRDRGGGLFIEGGGPLITSCTLEDSSALLGGGLYANGSAAMLSGIVLRDNAAARGGGAFIDGGTLVMSDCTITGGAAATGGGLALDRAAATLSAVVFEGNRASFDGGGLHAVASDAILDDCLFHLNVAGFDGGGGYTIASNPRFTACQFTRNIALAGGGLQAVGGAALLAGCTFVENFAEEAGGLMSIAGAPTVADCLFQRNLADRGAGAVHDGGDAWFIGCSFLDNTADGNGGGLRVGAGRSRVERCTFAGNTGGRLGGGMHVDGGGPVIRDCIFTGNLVEGGFVVNGGALSFFASEGAVVVGTSFCGNAAGFGGAVTIDQSDPAISVCRFEENSASLGGAIHVTGGSPVLTDCTLVGNAAVGAAISFGGGIYSSNGQPVLDRCTFDANTAEFDGGGMYTIGGDAVLSDCTFTGNTSGRDGGGLFNDQASPSLVRCRFLSNEASSSGGGVASGAGAPALTDCVLLGNVAAFGGGMQNFSGDSTILNGLFSGNVASGTRDEKGGCVFAGFGGGLGSFAGSLVITNVTFSGNIAACDGNGGGIAWAGGTLTNCVLWGNVDGGGSDESAQVSGVSTTVNYTCIQGLTGGLGGEGNIGLDPRYVDPDGPDGVAGTLDDDLRLAPGSPAIDAGSNSAVPAGVETDLDGNPRFADDPDTPDTGEGIAPIVDLGAYEFGAGGATCPEDLDGDGAVAFGDIVVVLAAWGPCPGSPACPADLDGSGVVDFADLVIVLAAWGPCE